MSKVQTRRSVSVSSAVHAQLEAIARANGCAVSAATEALLEDLRADEGTIARVKARMADAAERGIAVRVARAHEADHERRQRVEAVLLADPTATVAVSAARAGVGQATIIRHRRRLSIPANRPARRAS